jgi:23S rRNA A1618 N6-methylase RlmF
MFKALKKVQAKEVKKIEYGIGQKTTRVVAWHF